MAQSKRSFSQARLERDLDDRIVPKGTYRDALNISIDTSEDANVGVIENLKGNELIANQNITGLSSSSNPNAKVIGSYAHPEGNRIYYFVTGDKSDGIFEHNLKDNTIKTIIIDSSDFIASSPTKVTLPTFAFSDAVVVGTVTKDGTIGVSATLGIPFSLTPDFGASVSTNTTRVIQVQVTVPSGYSNTGKFVTGTVTATQAAIAAPVVNILDCTDITANSVTLNAEYTNDSAGVTAIGFYYTTNTGGSATVTNFTNEHVIRSLSGRSANLSSGAPLWTDPFDGVAASDLTVKDKDGTTITSSQYDYQNLAGPQPNTIYFKSNLGTVDQVHAKLPITVSQTSTGTTVTNALTAAQVQSSGTNATVTPITSPFSKAITGLSAGTTYAVVAYATNSAGTTLSSIKYFTTVASSIRRVPSNKLYVLPVAIGTDTAANQPHAAIGTSGQAGNTATDNYFLNQAARHFNGETMSKNPGYGPLAKTSNSAGGDIFFTIISGGTGDGVYSNIPNMTNGSTTDVTDGDHTFTNPTSQQNSFRDTHASFSFVGPATPQILQNSVGNFDQPWSAHVIDVSEESSGFYAMTVSRSGYTSNTTQFKIGTVSNAAFTSTFTANFAKTGTGAVPFLAAGRNGSHEFNVPSGSGTAHNVANAGGFVIGPMEAGFKGAVIISFANTVGANATGSDSIASSGISFTSFPSFDASKLDVSISGKTVGVDYDYYIFDSAPVNFGTNPGILIECAPSVLNSSTTAVTHTVNITYNY